MSQEDKEAFLKTIKRLVSEGGESIKEALALAKAMKKSMAFEKYKLSDMLGKLDADVQELYKKAQTSESLEDVCKLSELETKKDELSRQITENVIYYSTICYELNLLKQLSSSQRAPLIVAVAGSSSQGDATIASLTNKVEKLLAQMVDFWTTYDDRREDHNKSTEIKDIRGRKLRLQISDVRGDGACGWRAFVSGVIRLVCGKQLAYDPKQMIEFIQEVKLLLIELVGILAKNPANEDFINGLMTVPENGGQKNLHSYSAMVLVREYQATNFELRLLCVLFGLVNPKLSQVNIIRNTPFFGEIYQSISVSGRVLPVSNEQNNILQVPGHYKSIVHLTEGVLPPIILPDGAIIIN
jgi:hypothetical protein